MRVYLLLINCIVFSIHFGRLTNVCLFSILMAKIVCVTNKQILPLTTMINSSMMQKHVATTNITVGYTHKNKLFTSILTLIFYDWLYTNCTVTIDTDTHELTLSEEEFVWLIIAYPATISSKYIDINFDSYKKEN